MNACGRDLGCADMIGNFILMPLDRERQERLYADHLRPVERGFERHGEERFDAFIRHYLTLRTGEVPGQGEEYAAFKTHARSRRVRDAGPEALAADLRSCADRYRAMALGEEPDAELARAFGELASLDMKPVWPFLLHLFERLENHGREETVQLSSCTVDHVMPQGERLPEAWKEELGPDWAQVWQSLRHTLGNLTLTAFNPEMGNRTFSEKRDAAKGYRDSPLRLNQDLRTAERWDGDAIRARGARLAGEAVGIWARPVLSDRVLDPYRSPRPGADRYTLDHHPHLRPGAPMHDLFETVRQQILALGPGVREEVMRHYVAYKTRTNFVDVVPQKKRLLLTLNMRFGEIDDPRGLAADITNLGLWGNGDVQLEIDNPRQIAYAMELVTQAFEGKGAPPAVI